MTIGEDVGELKTKVAVLEEKIDTLEEEGKSRGAKLDLLLSKMDKYEGKLGGVLLVLGAIAAFFKIEWMKVFAYFKGGSP